MDNELKTLNKLEVFSQMGSEKTMSSEDLKKLYQAAENIKKVDVTFHTASAVVNLGKMSGVKTGELTEKEKVFIQKSGNTIRMELFPATQSKLSSMAVAISRKVKECSIKGSNYMNQKNFNDKFLPFIKEQEDKLKILKDGIREDFDKRMVEFERETLSIVTKLFPDKLNEVKKQIDNLKVKGCEGYIKQIGIEMDTDFSVSAVSKDELKLFLENLKKASAEVFIQELLNSFLGELWEAVISYCVNISQDRFSNAQDLKGFTNIRQNVREACSQVKLNIKPIEKEFPDIVELCKDVASLADVTDITDAPDIAFQKLAKIYSVSSKYDYFPSFNKGKSGTGATIPKWLDYEDIVKMAESI